MFTLKITREHSGMDGTYATLEAAISRLTEYSTAFYGEVTEVIITKI